MINKDMAKIDWENQTAQEIKHLVRGLNPIMGAYTFLDGKKIKFWKVDVVDEKEVYTENENTLANEEGQESIKNGTVILSDGKKGIFIKTKKGILKVIEIQGENAKRMMIQDYLRGNPVRNFEVFE